MLGLLQMPGQSCVSSHASGLLLGWRVGKDDLSFGGISSVGCAEMCPTGDVKGQGEMQPALGVFLSPELLFLTHGHHYFTEQRCKLFISFAL